MWNCLVGKHWLTSFCLCSTNHCTSPHRECQIRKHLVCPATDREVWLDFLKNSKQMYRKWPLTKGILTRTKWSYIEAFFTEQRQKRERERNSQDNWLIVQSCYLRTACASIDLFWLLEHTTAILMPPLSTIASPNDRLNEDCALDEFRTTKLKIKQAQHTHVYATNQPVQDSDVRAPFQIVHVVKL